MDLCRVVPGEEGERGEISVRLFSSYELVDASAGRIDIIAWAALGLSSWMN